MQDFSNKVKPTIGDDPALIEKSYESEKNIKEKFKKKFTLSEPESPNVSAQKRKLSPSKKKKSMKEKPEENLINNLKEYSKMKNKKHKLEINLMKGILSKEERDYLSKKIKMFKKAKEKIDFDLDIVNIFNKFQEIDKLKLVLFTPEQLLLFDMIGRPEIRYEEKEEYQNEEEMLVSQRIRKVEELNEQKLLDFVVYFNKVKKKGGDNLMERRLLKLIDNDMKNYFDL